MKIIVAIIGSRGYVQPYVNLCQGLQQAGHEVTLATKPTKKIRVEPDGVITAVRIIEDHFYLDAGKTKN